MTQEPAIILKDVGRSFHDDRPLIAVKDVSLHVMPGEFFVFVGLSGSGKSTLLRIMSGLDQPTAGSVQLGQGIGRGDLGFVFQQFALLPWLTVQENVGLGLIARGMSRKQRQQKVAAELVALGLSDLARAMPRQLSGGQRQRVGIARALVTNPKILFMDEPFSELDSLTAEQLRQEVLRLWQERKFTVVMVTHLLPEAIELADRIAVLKANPGRVAHIIENPLARPRDLRSQEMFKLEDTLRRYIL